MSSRRRFGSVRKLPSGRWQARYYDAAGDRFNAPDTFGTKGDAQRWLSAAETDLARGDWHDPRLAETPFVDWSQRWLAIKEPTLAPAAISLYRYLLRKLLLPRFERATVGEITAVVMQRWVADLHATDLSPNTVAKAYRLLKGMLDAAVDAGTIRVTRKLGEVEGQLTYSAPKTAAGRRTVGIPSFVARALELHLALYGEAGAEGLVFPAPEGGPLRRANFRQRVWLPATAAAGVPALRFHDLRHTAATLAAASGTSIKALMARIGHSSMAAAIRYQHVIDGQDADIVRFLERFDHSPQEPVEAIDDPSVTAAVKARYPCDGVAPVVL